MENEFPISRNEYLASTIVFIDGIEGCGKTMLAPIVSAFDRVELPCYAYEVEHLCALEYLGKLSSQAAKKTISLLADLQIYNLMQSREVNFRHSDISSVFKSGKSLLYLKRLFQAGDSASMDRIKADRPILLLTTHRMMAFGVPIFEALNKRLIFIEVVRHPLYMVIQNYLNFTSLLNTARDFTIYYEIGTNEFPYFVSGWEDLYLKSSPIDRAVHYLNEATIRSKKNRELAKESSAKVLTIPFESFVTNPDGYLKLIESSIGSSITSKTYAMLKRQNVPRKKYADSINLDVYRRCGWVPSKNGFSEQQELEQRRQWVASIASAEAVDILDALSIDYENTFMPK